MCMVRVLGLRERESHDRPASEPIFSASEPIFSASEPIFSASEPIFSGAYFFLARRRRFSARRSLFSAPRRCDGGRLRRLRHHSAQPRGVPLECGAPREYRWSTPRVPLEWGAPLEYPWSTPGMGSTVRVRWSSQSTLLRAQVEGKDLPALLMLYSSQVRRQYLQISV